MLAKQIKRDIQHQTRLIASAGISYNKFLAKVASDLGKPDGLYLITPAQGSEFVETLPVGRFHGIGRATEKKMHELGIQTGRDLKQLSLAVLQAHFGKAAQYYYDIARGVDNRPVICRRIRKSIGAETTFEEDIADLPAIFRHLQQLLQKTLAKLLEKDLEAYTLTVKIKYQNFMQITRGRTLPQPVNDSPGTQLLIADLLKNTAIGEKKVRLLGVTLSGLRRRGAGQCCRQMDLFDPV